MPFYLMESDGGNVPTIHEFKNEEAARKWIEENVKFDDVEWTDEAGKDMLLKLDLFEDGNLYCTNGNQWEVVGEDLNSLITKHE